MQIKMKIAKSSENKSKDKTKLASTKHEKQESKEFAGLLEE